MIGFDLLRPQFAWLALLVPLVLAGAGVFGILMRQRELRGLVHPTRILSFLPGRSRSRPILRLVLATSAVFFLCVAALGPILGYTFRETTSEGVDLVVCIDTSRSMLARDLRPSRLERARREVTGLLGRLRGDRCALIAFSGDAREVAPLTHDRATLSSLLEYISPEDNRLGGTSLGGAIENALDMFDGRTGANEAICLLTDGEDLEGRAQDVARIAAERGIRVFVVGIGTEGGGKIPIVGTDGRETFLRGPDGEEVVTRLQGRGLAELAELTGGAYLTAEQSPAPLEALYDSRISRIEGRELEGGLRRVPHDRYQWPLALAVLCLLAEAGLRERHRSRKRAAQARVGTILVGGLCLLMPQGDLPPSPLDPGTEFDFEEELAQVVEFHGESKYLEALGTAESLVARARESELSDTDRARLQFALGVVRADVEEMPISSSVPPFRAARALAGPGELRLDSTYDQGTSELVMAEELRQEIPEIAAASGAAAPQAAPTGPTAPGEPEADALTQARAAYEVAKATLVERLRADWSDENTRANLELIQRRLRELDEIERKRQEEQQEQEEQEQEEQSEDESSEDQQEGEEGEENQEQSEDQEGEGEEEQSEEDPAEEEEPSDEDPESGESPNNETESVDSPEEGDVPEGAAPQEFSEEHLTREEVMRLLDRLEDLEAEGEALRERLKESQRVPVDRDW